jgi:hypothetical protein
MGMPSEGSSFHSTQIIINPTWSMMNAIVPPHRSLRHDRDNYNDPSYHGLVILQILPVFLLNWQCVSCIMY